MKLKRKLQVPTDTTHNPLKRHETAILSLLQYRNAHLPIFEQYEALQESAAVTLEEAKTYIKQTKRGLETDLFQAEYVEAKRRWHDASALAADLGERLGIEKATDLITSTDLITTESVVDEKKLTKLVAAGVVPVASAQISYREEPQAVRVNITRKDA